MGGLMGLRLVSANWTPPVLHHHDAGRERQLCIGANRFKGSAGRLVRQNNREFGATSFNTNLVLQLNTSFTGKDLLFTELRSGTLVQEPAAGGRPQQPVMAGCGLRLNHRKRKHRA